MGDLFHVSHRPLLIFNSGEGRAVKFEQGCRSSPSKCLSSPGKIHPSPQNGRIICKFQMRFWREKFLKRGGGHFHFCRACWFCVCFTWFGLMNPASWNDEIEIKNFDLLREWRFFEIQTGERGRDGKWTLWLHQNKTQPKS